MKRSLKNIIMILIIIAVGVCSYFTMRDTQEISNGLNMESQPMQGGPNGSDMSKENPPQMPTENSNNGNMEEPPTKPGEEKSGGNNIKPKDIPNMNEQNSENMIKPIHYVMFAMEGFIIAVMISYIIMSQFNKLTLRETIAGANKIIIFILLVAIITIALTFTQIYITKSVFVINNVNELNSKQI